MPLFFPGGDPDDEMIFMQVFKKKMKEKSG